MDFITGLFMSGVYSLIDYLSLHVITCLVPALFIGGAISAIFSQAAVLKYLPEVVIPEGDKNWNYRQVYNQAAGSIKVVEKNASFMQEYWSDGVRPIGHYVLVDILSKSLRDIGNSPSWVQNLIK